MRNAPRCWTSRSAASRTTPGSAPLRRHVQDLRTGLLPRHQKGVSGVHGQERVRIRSKTRGPQDLAAGQKWHYLAADFTQYFRIMLVHQGLPQWQFKFTPMDLTPWAEQMFVLIAPHLLQSDVNNPLTQSVDWCDMPYNHLDPAIFKTGEKSSKKKADPAKIKPF
ncbi:hypothetical protein ANN_17554 [Periplaneta americana]|uniref:Uncharacterized protein n=1 Tax=Periplaneta americana TaxID=6978 RepID=A0ABQ8ST96_PERAM|nr:hypothetical protein ANN_17554 [Periplaneta americana]